MVRLAERTASMRQPTARLRALRRTPSAERTTRSTAGAVNGNVKLPDFVTLEGTLGKPDPKPNYGALATGTFKGLRNLVPNTGRAIGNTGTGLLNDIGGMIRGRDQSNTNAPPTTNQNQSPVNNLFNRFLGPK